MINDLFSLKNKTVVLTGSAGRLGNQFANVLSAAGANMVLVDKELAKNKKLQLELTKKYNTKSLVCQVDISNKKSLVHMTKDIIKKFGHIDVLVNNAYFNPNQSNYSHVSFEEFPVKLWEQMLLVNLTGVFLCSQEIGKVLLKQRRGVIVNISSIYGLNGADQRIYGNSKLNSSISYAATKGAVVNMTRYLAACWHRKNIRVNTLSLGGVLDKSYMKNEFVKKYSEKTMLGRMANKEEYRGAILFLASNASSYMTGSNLIVDGGWTAW